MYTQQTFATMLPRALSSESKPSNAGSNYSLTPFSALLTIIQHELKVDAKKISTAWPDDRGEKPTPRAITERLVKIRANSRASGAGHFSVSSSQTKSSSPAKPRSTPNTPSKPKNSGSYSTVSPSKRKTPGEVPKQVKQEDDDDLQVSCNPRICLKATSATTISVEHTS